MELSEPMAALLRPKRLLSRTDVLARPSSVPRAPGLYAWYFDVVPPGVSTSDCIESDFGPLLYIGISPGRPSADGRPPSSENLYKRVRYHFTGNAEGSTLRLTLGCHLSNVLGIELRRVGSGRRMTFTNRGEQALSAWMGTHARVAVVEDSDPWQIEPEAIAVARVPLNIDHNRAHPFYATNRAVRASHKARARELPVWSLTSDAPDLAPATELPPTR